MASCISEHFRSGRVAVALLVGIAVALSGCASGRGSDSLADVASAPPDTRGLHLELIMQMIEDGKGHAALAHLDSLEADTASRPEAQLLRAEALRHVGSEEDAALAYTGLIGTPMEALAQRGLGLLAARRGELMEATVHLRRARELKPVDPRIRNDLGFALLIEGELDQARAELLTAVELGEGERAARNLVLLLLAEGREAAASRMAAKHGLRPDALAAMRATAIEIQRKHAVTPGASNDPGQR